MKIAVTDYTFETLDFERQILEAAGCEVVGKRCKTREELIALVGDADCVITQFAPVDAHVIGAMQRARAIVRYGIGVDNVDLHAARLRGIAVCNVPDYCIDEVADHTLAFILASTRGVVPNTNLLRSGKWGLAVPITSMRALRDATVGVVGLGRIGREVCRRLRAFGARIIVFDPGVTAAQIEAENCLPSELPALLASSDVITLHCPSNDHTRRMINRETLATMKPGVVIVNVGRGDLVDMESLVEALQSGQVGAAALDVFVPEPYPADGPLLQIPNVVVSAHIASVSVKAVKCLRETVANIALKAIREEPLPNVVNGVKK